MKIEGNVLTDENTRNHGTPDVSWTQTASTLSQCLQPGTNGHNMAQDGTTPVEMLGYVLQPYTPLNLKEKELPSRKELLYCPYKMDKSPSKVLHTPKFCRAKTYAPHVYWLYLVIVYGCMSVYIYPNVYIYIHMAVCQNQ